MKISLSDTQKKVVFHFCLWGIWLYLTLSNAHDDEFYNRAVLITSLILFTHIPLFVFNTEWLIPKVLHKKGVNIYFWSLIASILIFSIFHGYIIEWVNDYLQVVSKREYRISKSIIVLVLVAAISTGYGLLNDFVVQERKREEKEKEKLQSELSFLRSQISPHFIFNILNSIVYLIRSNTQLAESVTLKLSDLMRYMLYDSENSQIHLDKEISYVENYVDLQKIRFEEDVDIRYTVEGHASNQILEPMLLIPFVENAFKHGIGMVADPTIIVDVKINPGDMYFTVKNKISPESSNEKDLSSGIGLKNVQRRLELIYPKTHELTIKNENGWFIVVLHLTF